MVAIGIGIALFALGYYAFRKAKISFKFTDVMVSLLTIYSKTLLQNTLTQTKLNILDPTTMTTKLRIKFKDVAGLHEAKVEINEFVDYLKNPSKYTVIFPKDSSVNFLFSETRCKTSKRCIADWSARMWKNVVGKGIGS